MEIQNVVICYSAIRLTVLIQGNADVEIVIQTARVNGLICSGTNTG